jgi:hypothetical protein
MAVRTLCLLFIVAAGVSLAACTGGDALSTKSVSQSRDTSQGAASDETSSGSATDREGEKPAQPPVHPLSRF